MRSGRKIIPELTFLKGYRDNFDSIKEKIGNYRDGIKGYSAFKEMLSVIYWQDIVKMIKDDGFQEKAGVDLSDLIRYLEEKF